MFNSIYVNYLERLATEINAECCTSGELEVVADQTRFKMYLFPASEGGQVYIPAYFQLKTKMPPSCGCFAVRRNDVLDWIAERIFFNQDFQVGDENFDSQFFITAENDIRVSKFFSKQNVRKNISELLSNDFHKIYAKDNELVVIRYVKSTDDFPSKEMIQTAIQKIQQIHLNSQ